MSLHFAYKRNHRIRNNSDWYKFWRTEHIFHNTINYAVPSVWANKVLVKDFLINVNTGRHLRYDWPDENSPFYLISQRYYLYKLSHKTILISQCQASAKCNVLRYLVLAGWSYTTLRGKMSKCLTELSMDDTTYSKARDEPPTGT